MSKLRVAYNNIYRKVLGYSRRDSSSEMFVSNGMDTFDVRMRKATQSFKGYFNQTIILLII